MINIPAEGQYNMNNTDFCPHANFVEFLWPNFYDRMLKDFPNDNLPYGVNVEIFTVSSLENAFINASRDFDLKHVTPWIKRYNNCSGMSPYISINQRPYVSSELSLTIDNYNELERMRGIFDKVNEPIEESWFKICQIGFQSKP